MVSDLTRYVGGVLDSQTPQQWRCNQRRIRVVDGTTVTLPDTPENQQAFPQQSSQKEGLGFPICRLVGITCLSSGALQNAAIGRFKGKGGDEQTLLRSIQDTFEPGDIVMGDAFFATCFFIAQMQTRGVDILMAQNGARKRIVDFRRRGQRLGTKDHLIVLNRPKVKPCWMDEICYQSAPLVKGRNTIH